MAGHRPRRWRESRFRSDLRHDAPIHLGLGCGLLLSFIPLAFMIVLSFKSSSQFLKDPLGVTFPLNFDNYSIAFAVTSRSMLNTAGLALFNVVGVLVVATLAAYAFTLMRFPGRSALYWLVLAVLFVPSILTFAPRFVVASQLHLTNTYAVLTLPYIAGAQVLEIFILVSFFRSIAPELLVKATLRPLRFVFRGGHLVVFIAPPFPIDVH